jgi:hypothetical protein
MLTLLSDDEGGEETLPGPHGVGDSRRGSGLRRQVDRRRPGRSRTGGSRCGRGVDGRFVLLPELLAPRGRRLRVLWANLRLRVELVLQRPSNLRERSLAVAK